ncbi:MAG: hypothetical protein ACKVI4_05005 [Actinomycetales bacterium]
MAEDTSAAEPKPAPAQSTTAPKLQQVSRPQGVQRTPRKRRFPWPRIWVWAAVVVGIAFAAALVLKLAG